MFKIGDVVRHKSNPCLSMVITAPDIDPDGKKTFICEWVNKSGTVEKGEFLPETLVSGQASIRRK